MDRDGTIGDRGALPWRLPADLRHFRELTWGYPILMGRRTHESIGRALPGRRNIVLTTQKRYRAPGCEVYASCAAALAACQGADEVMIIGGAKLYLCALPRVACVYLTEVHARVGGDTRLPHFAPEEWREVSHHGHPADDANEYAYSFVTLQRRH